MAMALAGYAVEWLFGVLHLIPAQRHALVRMAHLSWNYTTVLNIIFATLSLLLIFRFATTGGPKMLRMMSMPHMQGKSGGTQAYEHPVSLPHDGRDTDGD
jgi:hypothetical protein